MLLHFFEKKKKQAKTNKQKQKGKTTRGMSSINYLILVEILIQDSNLNLNIRSILFYH